MKYKEFKEWVQNRLCDGCWGSKEALLCIHVYREIEKMPFWKRNKQWKEEAEYLVPNVIEPINEKIKIFAGNISNQNEIGKNNDWIKY